MTPDINYRARQLLEQIGLKEPTWNPPSAAAEYESLVAFVADHLRAAELRGKIEGLREAAGICRHHAIECSRDAANFRGGSNPNAIRLANSALHAKDAAAISARLASLQPEVAKREDVLP